MMFHFIEIGRPSALVVAVVNEFISAGSHQSQRGAVDASTGKQGLGAADCISCEHLGVPRERLRG